MGTPHDHYRDEYGEPILRSVGNSRPYVHDNLLAHLAQGQLPMVSALGAGPVGPGVIPIQVSSGDGTYRFQLVSDETGDVLLTSENLHPGIINVDAPEHKPVAGEAVNVVIRVRRGADVEEHSITIPPGAVGSRWFIGPDAEHDSQDVYVFRVDEMLYDGLNVYREKPVPRPNDLCAFKTSDHELALGVVDSCEAGQAVIVVRSYITTPIITIGEDDTWLIDGVDTGLPSKGDRGDDGKNAVVSIGNVEALPPGNASASVTVDSDTNTYYLNLGIPEGAPGKAIDIQGGIWTIDTLPDYDETPVNTAFIVHDGDRQFDLYVRGRIPVIASDGGPWTVVEDWQGRPGTGTHVLLSPYVLGREVGSVIRVPAAELSLAFSPSDYMSDGDIVIDTEMSVGVLGSTEDESGDYSVETKGTITARWKNMEGKPFDTVADGNGLSMEDDGSGNIELSIVPDSLSPKWDMVREKPFDSIDTSGSIKVKDGVLGCDAPENACVSIDDGSTSRFFSMNEVQGGWELEAKTNRQPIEASWDGTADEFATLYPDTRTTPAFIFDWLSTRASFPTSLKTDATAQAVFGYNLADEVTVGMFSTTDSGTPGHERFQGNIRVDGGKPLFVFASYSQTHATFGVFPPDGRYRVQGTGSIEIVSSDGFSLKSLNYDVVPWSGDALLTTDMLDESASNGAVYIGENGKLMASVPSGEVSWDDVTGKPATYPHDAIIWDEVTGKPATYPHDAITWDEVTGKPFDSIGDGLVVSNDVMSVDSSFFTTKACTAVSDESKRFLGESGGDQWLLSAKTKLTKKVDSRKKVKVKCNNKYGSMIMSKFADAFSSTNTSMRTTIGGTSRSVSSIISGYEEAMQQKYPGSALARYTTYISFSGTNTNGIIDGFCVNPITGEWGDDKFINMNHPSITSGSDYGSISNNKRFIIAVDNVPAKYGVSMVVFLIVSTDRYQVGGVYDLSVSCKNITDMLDNADNFVVIGDTAYITSDYVDYSSSRTYAYATVEIDAATDSLLCTDHVSRTRKTDGTVFTDGITNKLMVAFDPIPVSTVTSMFDEALAVLRSPQQP